MSTQNPSTNVPSYLDLGNAIVYYSSSTFTSFANAVSSTTWRKLGVLRAGVSVDLAKSSVDIKSGVPQRLVKRFFVEETLKVSGEMMEISPFNLARALGGLPPTVAVKSASPAATTVASASTKAVVKVASSSGYAVDDLIRVGNVGSYQYGVIKTISGNDLTLYESLDGDANPTTGHAVAKVDTMSYAFGSVATPADISLKISKTLVAGFGTMDLYIPKANAEANMTLNWEDNGTPNSVALPFSFEAVSDSSVESGNLAQVIFTQT